ncbi:MAG: metallophosphoesterase [Curtobacterium sp.]
MKRRRSGTRFAAIAVGSGLMVALAITAAPIPQPAHATSDPVIAAAGDIACTPTDPVDSSDCQQAATAALLKSLSPTAVLPLGDVQYDSGTASEFSKSYGPTWGSLLSSSHPIPGNHEYITPGAAGYYGFFGSAAGSSSKGYYSWNLGSWHLIALNSECGQSSQIGCTAGSPEETWLKADLAAHPNQCTLAYWHEPRFSSGNGGSNSIYSAFWQDLYNAHADIVLNGHTHAYERFAQQNPSGAADPNGIREFVVGTGGESFYGFTSALPNETVRQNSTFGVLTLTLHASSYDWKFNPIAGSSWTDSGTAACHTSGGTAADTTPPSTPGSLTSTATSGPQVDLAWSASTDNVGVTGYRVYRGSSTTPMQVLGAGVLRASDTTVTAGSTYTYRVTAVDAAGNESPAATTTVTVPPQQQPPPSSGPTFVSAAAVGGTMGARSASQSVTVPAPASVAAGDLLLAVVYNARAWKSTNPYTGTAPAGWTALDSGHYGVNSGFMQVFWRIAGSTEPSSYTFSESLSGGATDAWYLSATVARYTGSTGSAPAVGYRDNATGTTATAPSVTASGPGTQAAVYGYYDGASVGAAPSGFTQESVFRSAGNNTVVVFDKPLASAGATGTTTVSNSSDSSVGCTLVLR